MIDYVERSELINYISSVIAQENVPKKTKLFVIWWYAHKKEWWKLQELASNFNVEKRTILKYMRPLRKTRMIEERWDTATQKKEYRLL